LQINSLIIGNRSLASELTACTKSFAIRVRPSYSGGARLRPSAKAITVAQGSAV